MVDDKGITVQGEKPNAAQLAAAARLRNDLDRDGTPDHLAGTAADSHWESFPKAREEVREQLTADFVAARDGLKEVGTRLHSDLQRDPQFRGSPMEAELAKSLEGDAPSRNPAGMERAINAVAVELDAQAERGDRAAQMWREGDLRYDLQRAHGYYEDTSEALLLNRADMHRFEVASRDLHVAGTELHAAMQQDRQWEGSSAEAELRDALQGENAQRHPERTNAAVLAISQVLDRQAEDGLPAAQHWKESDLRDRVVNATAEFEVASAKLASQVQDSAIDAAAPAWEAQYDATEAKELRAEAKAFNAGSALEEIPASASQNVALLQAYREGVTTKEEQLLAERPEDVRSEQLERVREQLGKVDRSIEAAQAEEAATVAVAQQDAGRWTVQQYDAERGVYRDTLTTDDVLIAYAEVQKSDHHRVLDNDLKDVAADYVDVDLGDGNYPRQLEFHGRSEFERQLVSAGAQIEVREPETLHEVLERRAQLDATVLQRSDEISAAVDRARDPQVPDQVVVEAYAQASRGYAEAMRARAEFEAAPSADPSVVADYRRVQQLEAEMAKADSQASHARAHGDADLAVEFASKSDGASLQLDQLLEERGASETYRYPETARNEIEVPLSKEQVDRLTGQGKSSPEKDQEADAGKPGRVVMPPPLPSVGEGHNQVRDQSAFADAAAKDKLVPEDVASRYKKDGQKYLDANDPKKVAFVDKGNRLQTSRSFDDKAVEDMVAIADARGMTAFKVSGDEGFRRKAWIEGTARGIDVTGYEPTEKDKLRADQLAKQTGRANAIETNEVVEAYRAARDGSAQQKKEAAKKHPELANAFALEQAAKSFAKQRLAPESQDKLVNSIRDSIERDLAQGKKIPEVRLRQERERRQDRGAER